ncbi:hypothetical protein ACF0H5_024588 [Mactra antiquata]
MGSGKEQKIRIEASSGLSESEIEQMIKEAELNASADQELKESVELTNQAEHLIYGVNKSLKDLGDKVKAEDRAAIESASNALQESLKNKEPKDAVKTKMEALQQAAATIAEQMKEQAEAAAGPANEAADRGEPSGPKATDADYEVVDDK